MQRKKIASSVRKLPLGIMEVLIIATSLVVVMSIFIDVFLRYVFGFPLWGAETVAMSVMVWLWFTALPYSIYRRFQIASTFPIRRRLAQDIFGIFTPCFCIIICLVTSYYFYLYSAWTLTHHTMDPVLRFPLFYIVIPGLIGLLLASVYFTRDIVANVRAFRHSGKEAQQ